MNVPAYRSSLLRVEHALDELEARGLSPEQAGQQLKAALLERTLNLWDLNASQSVPGGALGAAARMIDSYLAMRLSGKGKADPYDATYLRSGVTIRRADFEHVFSIGINAAAAEVLKSRRFATDATLVEEAVEGIRFKRWPNKHQAAIALAVKAEGNATTESKIDRLEKKITKRLEKALPRKSSKHPETSRKKSSR